VSLCVYCVCHSVCVIMYVIVCVLSLCVFVCHFVSVSVCYNNSVLTSLCM